MTETLLTLLFLLNRYIHIVATTVIVGGTLFYELVVPWAIGELKTEVQLALFGRMRWMFRWLVYVSTIALLLSGTVSAYRNRNVPSGDYERVMARFSSEQTVQRVSDASIFNRPKGWFIAHLATGALALGIAVMLVSGGRPPNRPIQWMKLNLFVLLIAIFVGSASRNARTRIFDAVRGGEVTPAARE